MLLLGRIDEQAGKSFLLGAACHLDAVEPVSVTKVRRADARSRELEKVVAVGSGGFRRRGNVAPGPGVSCLLELCH